MNDRRRRTVALALVGSVLAAPRAVFAQPRRARVARIGMLESTSTSASQRDSLIAGLRELGLVEGRDVAIEYRWAEGNYERLPALAAELVRMNVDVIVAAGTPAVQAAREATTSIPIVMVRVGDPIDSGFVASLSRPGGNVTGLSNLLGEVASKYVELLRVAVPTLARVSVLLNPNNAIHPDYLKRIQASAKTNAVTVSPLQASTAGQVEAAFAATKQERADALIVLGDPFLAAQSPRIAELAVQQRLPTMFWTRTLVEAGGLMSYGQFNTEHYRRAASYIDKLLKGAKAGELPVEQATKVELAINLKTAKAIGLTIPQQLLLQADKVIE